MEKTAPRLIAPPADRLPSPSIQLPSVRHYTRTSNCRFQRRTSLRVASRHPKARGPHRADECCETECHGHTGRTTEVTHRRCGLGSPTRRTAFGNRLYSLMSRQAPPHVTEREFILFILISSDKSRSGGDSWAGATPARQPRLFRYPVFSMLPGCLCGSGNPVGRIWKRGREIHPRSAEWPAGYRKSDGGAGGGNAALPPPTPSAQDD